MKNTPIFRIETDGLTCTVSNFDEAISIATKLSETNSVYILQNNIVLRIFRHGNEVFRKQNS